uniref:(northern house mosquito) hypothetical protein n=1 Tax=Culex pipiens TaxID=7175 RepID=A0A8D8GJP1_CULPI
MMMMGNAQIRTHTFQAAGRVRTISQNAKTAANQSAGGGGCGLGNTEIKLEEFSRRTIIQHFWGERAHTHLAGTAIVTRVQLWNQTLARVSTILITLPFSGSSPAQLLIHLSFSPLIPFLSSVHVFFLAISSFLLDSPGSSRTAMG